VGETRNLLQSRLRNAAIMLGVAFGVFLIRHFFRVDVTRSGDIFLFVLHIVAVVGLIICARSLRENCPRSLLQLRVFEWIIFGLPAVFFIAIQYSVTLNSSLEGVMDFPEGLWLVLIYTYTIFIPNTWQRAAVVIGLMASMPLLLLFGMMWHYPVMAERVTLDQITGLALMFLVCGVGSVFGVNIIGSLRREAFEARQLGQYRLTQRIGMGGMGEVFLAEHQLLKRPCVVKLIRPDKAGNPKNLARFQREVRATAKLSHWNTVEIFDYGCTQEGTFYYVMEYLPGMSLSELVERFGPMPPERVIYLLRQACDALNEAHAIGLVHRDLKPANIFAAQRGGVYDVTKLLDFGLVKPLVEEEAIQITADGAIAGSPLFMSPEQALGDNHPDGRSDIYSLGAVAYFLLTGRPPFQGAKPLKVIFAHANEPVTPPSTYRPDIPADLEQVILRCLAKDPKDRFPDAASLREALAGCASAGLWDRKKAAKWWHEKVEPGAKANPA
jgi:serine/threonine-protein kinase